MHKFGILHNKEVLTILCKILKCNLQIFRCKIFRKTNLTQLCWSSFEFNMWQLCLWKTRTTIFSLFLNRLDKLLVCILSFKCFTIFPSKKNPYAVWYQCFPGSSSYTLILKLDVYIAQILCITFGTTVLHFLSVLIAYAAYLQEKLTLQLFIKPDLFGGRGRILWKTQDHILQFLKSTIKLFILHFDVVYTKKKNHWNLEKN